MSERLTPDVLREKLARLFNLHPVSGVLAFGSLASGAVHADSDVDLAVLPQRTALGNFGRLHDQLVGEVARVLSLSETRIDVKFLPEMPLVLRFKAFQQGSSVYVRDAASLREELLRTAARYHDEYPYIREANKRFFSTLRTPAVTL